MSRKDESKTFRFAVGTPQNPQSSIWRLWVQGDDVYIGTRTTLTFFKVSLHKSNIWRIAFVADLDRADMTSDRVIKKWCRPEEFAPGWTTSIGILVPGIRVQRPFTHQKDYGAGVKWFSAPTEGKRLLFKVLFSKREYSENELKQISKERDQVAARIVKESGEVVWLIIREEDLSIHELQQVRDVMTKTQIHLSANSSVDSIGGSHALLFTWDDQPTASTQPTIFDIPMGQENVTTA